MTTVLVLTSSALGDASASNALIRDALAQLRAQETDLRVITRDLGAEPVPHLTAQSAAGIGPGEPANAEQAAARALSDTLIAELKAADILVVGAPMYNFGIPSTLKAWFDHVLRAGITFRYTEAGPEGMLPGKRAIVVETRGGLYSEGPAVAMDAQEPHLTTLFGFIGITDVTFVRAERLALGAEHREAALTSARARLDEVVRGELLRAA